MQQATRAHAVEESPYFGSGRQGTPYDRWVEGLGIPVHRGYYIEDVRTIELGWWEERGCSAAILGLEGQRGVSESRVSEIPPGRSTKPLKMTVDELVYVAQGRGLTTVWQEGGDRAMFEWGPGALFLIPRFHVHEFTNASGSEPARLLHANYLPLVMSITPEAEVYFDSPIAPPPLPPDQLYSAARMLTRPASYAPGGVTTFWYGNFFPDMRIWDQLAFQSGRGAGARSVTIELPNSPMSAHMPVFHAGLYKKAHRHGPAFVIVIPAGEGYSIMWPQGQEKVIVPWHEASVFVPPAGWYHQHFNVGATPARYLALHPPRGFNDHFRAFKGQDDDGGEGADRSPATLGQIEYPDEEVWIREYFEAELGKRGLKSRMPPEAYRDRDFQWSATAE